MKQLFCSFLLILSFFSLPNQISFAQNFTTPFEKDQIYPAFYSKVIAFYELLAAPCPEQALQYESTFKRYPIARLLVEQVLPLD